MRTTVIAYSVHKGGESPVHGETATHVALDDDGAGPYIVLSQDDDKVKIDFTEIDDVFNAVKLLKGQEGVE